MKIKELKKLSANALKHQDNKISLFIPKGYHLIEIDMVLSLLDCDDNIRQMDIEDIPFDIIIKEITDYVKLNMDNDIDTVDLKQIVYNHMMHLK